MRNLFKIFTILLPVFFTFSAFSQDTSMTNSLRFTIDFARFQKDNENSYIELYYSYSPQALVKVEQGKITELLIQFLIKNRNTGEISVDRMWKLRNEMTVALQSNSLVGINRFILPMGQYNVLIKFSDINNMNLKDSTSFDLEIPYNKENYMTLSDIELCSSIKQIDKDTSNIFYKNGMEVKPNPFGIIHYEFPLLAYYVEGYNLQKSFLGENLNTGYRVLDSYGREVAAKSFKKSLTKEKSVEAGIVNLNNFPGGSYYFIFSVLDSNNKILISKQKRFFIYNPSIAMKPKDVNMMEENEFSMMSSEDLDRQFKQAKYVASKDEIDEYALLKTTEGKRTFFNNFWKKRNTDIFNYKIYFERIDFANTRFRTKYSDGWFTDRGRVCAMYGIPEETFLERGKIEEGNGKPYEIWYYPSVLNGVYFIFVDESGFSNYRLVHSTHPNEMRNQDWSDFLSNRK